MATPLRPMSETYSPACCSVRESMSYSTDAGLVDDDRAPIFSISKSSMDVMTTGMPNKQDPAWTRLDLRRSSSTNTHSEQDVVTPHPPRAHVWQHANSHRPPITSQSMDVHSPPALSERWISNMQRWSGCSSSTHSRSSTPDTMVWRGSSSRPSSLSQDASSRPSSLSQDASSRPSSLSQDASSRPSSLSHDASSLVLPDSPFSKLSSPPTSPSPFISPLHTPTLPPVDLLGLSTFRRSTQKQEDLLESSPVPSPLRTLPSSPFQIRSPHHRLSSTNEEYLNNNTLTFQFPSPNPSSDNLSEAERSSSPRCLVNSERLVSPRELSEDDGEESPMQQIISNTAPDSPAAEQESRGEQRVVGQLEVPGKLKQLFPTEQGQRPKLVSSISDSRLEFCCRCSGNQQGTVKVKSFLEEATSTSQLDRVDAAVQTVTPVCSWWNIKRDLSSSNIGSPSILGSPPGSKLNLKSSIGSFSNLVSPSSSMFPVSSGEEDRGEEGKDPKRDVASPTSPPLERRRSCLKMNVEGKSEMGRRSSMKQVQWDEDGMTWDIHGASVDPEELTTAIQKHLELQKSPHQKKRSSKKKKAPQPPVLTNVVTALIPDRSMPVMIVTAEEEGGEEGQTKKPEQATRRRSRADPDLINNEKDDEVYGEEDSVESKSQSQEGGHRKRSVMRSLKRPGWCGGAQKLHD